MEEMALAQRIAALLMVPFNPIRVFMSNPQKYP
jgi:hypothetical protein